MPDYEPKIHKFSGQEDSAQWIADFISEIGGPGGPREWMKHIYFSQCLKGAVLEWYCNDLEYRAKVYWDMLSAAFDTCWKLIANNVPAELPMQSTIPPTTAIPAPTNTATPATTTAATTAHTDTAVPTTISETAATPERLDRALDVQHITPIPA